MKTIRPLISIIVPVYNGEKLVSQCIESIIRQDYNNIEIIIVDDGSKDNTFSIIRKLAEKDNRIKIITKKNGGVSSARNVGIEASKGEYITFVDADDNICDNYISYLYSLIIKNDADISLTWTANKFRNDNYLVHARTDDDALVLLTGLEAAESMLYYKIIISSWNKMFSKRILMENSIKFNENLSFGEGFEFVIRNFLKSKRVVIGNCKVYNYRVDNENSVMTRFSKKLVTGSIEAQKIILSDIGNNDKLLKAWKYSNWHTHYDCLNTIVGCKVVKQNKNLYKDVKKVCKKDAYVTLKSPIKIKDKIKGILYFINPYFAARLINFFRIRKFTK